MKPKVYIETSVVSYLTARPTNDLLAASWQNATYEWWENQKNDYELVRKLCANQGWRCPEICTPLELMEGNHA